MAMSEQSKRHRRAAIVGTAVAFLLAFVVYSFFTIRYYDPLWALAYAGPASGSAYLSVHCVWRPAMMRQENRRRGLWFGVLTGFAAFIIMAFVMTFIFTLPEVLQDRNSFISSVSDLIMAIFVFLFYGLALGGFLALPAGGLLGWYFSRNPDMPSETPPTETPL